MALPEPGAVGWDDVLRAYLEQLQVDGVDLTAYTPTAELALVATSGNYLHLFNRPNIPTTPGAVGADPAGSGQAARDYARQRQNHTGQQPADSLSDATVIGLAVLRAADAAAARTALGIDPSATVDLSNYYTKPQIEDREDQLRTDFAEIAGAGDGTGAKVVIVDVLPANDPAKAGTLYVVRP